MKLRLGTRGSLLARAQSGLVAAALEGAGHEVTLVTIVTEGDVRLSDTAWGDGAFVGALEGALRRGDIDLAVHSAKDVPIEPEDDLVIAAYPPRADPRDALIAREPSLPPGATVGTDSPRRAAFLLAVRPDLRAVPLHGNVDTRLRRLDAGEVDASILAVAGLERIGRAGRINRILDPDVMTPAPGQGALAVQVRAADPKVRSVVAELDDGPTRRCVELERALLRAAGGGCRAPLGALANIVDGRLAVMAMAQAEPGEALLVRSWSGSVHETEGIAVRLAGELREAGYRRSEPAGSVA